MPSNVVPMIPGMKLIGPSQYVEGIFTVTKLYLNASEECDRLKEKCARLEKQLDMYRKLRPAAPVVQFRTIPGGQADGK